MKSVYNYSNHEKTVFVNLNVLSKALTKDEQDKFAQEMLKKYVINPKDFYLDDVQDFRKD